MNYKNLKKTEREAAIYYGATCILSLLRDEDLRLCGIEGELLNDVIDARQQDDFIGTAAAVFGHYISNADLTEQDRTVAAQVLSVAAGSIARKYVLTESMLDGEDVLSNETILKNLYDWLAGAPETVRLFGDSADEEVKRIVDYIENYNRVITDNSRIWLKSGKQNEDETANPYPSFFDWVPFVGK